LAAVEGGRDRKISLLPGHRTFPEHNVFYLRILKSTCGRV
jgi:hypothetical protein